MSRSLPTVQLVPFALVLWGGSLIWRSDRQRLLCCLLLLFGPPISPSVWLSTINSQVFCGIASLILLLEDFSRASRRRRWIYRGLLAFNGLSGPYTALLFPGFLWRALRLRSREAWIHLAIVGATAALQGFAYVMAGFGSSLAPDRFTPLSFTTALSSILVFHVLGAWCGNELADLVGASMGLAVKLDFSLPTGGLAGGWLVLCSVGLIVFGVWLLRNRESWVLPALGANFVVLAITLAVIAHGLPWRRYAVVPGMVLLLMTLIASWEDRATLRRTASRALIVVALAFGVATFWRDAPVVFDELEVTYFGQAPNRPDWREEVALWRRDPAYRLRVWPFSGARSWKAYLTQPGDFQRVRLDPPGEWRLIVLGEQVERRVEILDPPGDFRLHVTGSASAGQSDLVIDLILTSGGSQPAVLDRRRLRSLSPEGRFEATLNPSYLEELEGAAGAERWLVLRIQGREEGGARVVLDRVAVVPRIEGLLDRWGLATTRIARGGGSPAEVIP